MPERTPGRYGRRSRSAPRAEARPAADRVVPPHPAAEDYLGALPGWQLLGNDRAGTVTRSLGQHARLVTATLAAEHYPTQEQVWEFYRTQNRTSTGRIQRRQRARLQRGPGHGCPGRPGVPPRERRPRWGQSGRFAKVDHTNLDEVDAAWPSSARCGSGSSPGREPGAVLGRPAVDRCPRLGRRRRPRHPRRGYSASEVKFITWAEETGFDLSFWNGTADGSPLVEECW